MLGWRHCGHRFGCALKRIIFQKTFHDDGCSFQIEKQKWQSDDLHESSLCHKNYKVRQTPTRKADFERKSFSLACRRHSAPTRFYLSYVFTILTMQQLSIVFFRFFNFFIRSHVMENCSSVSFHRKRAFEKNNRLPRILDFTKIRNNPLYSILSICHWHSAAFSKAVLHHAVPAPTSIADGREHRRKTAYG